jgi:3-hydroxyisobutyrate dehydrogenase
MKVGYIGLGAMGGALARRLAGSHELCVWDLNNAAIASFETLGAASAPSAADLARRCEVVILCLPRSADVRKVVFDRGGLAEGLSAGKLVIDQTSGVPGETFEIAQHLAARGVTLIDAPVSGGISGAAAGTIAIMVSGPDEACQRALPVLTAISQNVFRCSARVGDAQALKLVNNMLWAGSRMAMLEIVAMGRKMGLSLASVTHVLNKGSGRNRTSQVVLQNMVDGKPSTARFALTLMLKDANQAVELGMQCGAPTPISNVARGLLQVGVSTLGDQAQLDDTIGLIESMARTRIADDDRTEDALPSGASFEEGGRQLRVGYVGLGTMGGALTRRLMLSREIKVFDVRRELVDVFAAEGGTPMADLPTLARECDVIMICVPTSAIVREVVFGKGGLAEALTPGKIIIDQTTGDPNVTRSIATDLQERGVSLVDAPVSGGPAGASAGNIAIMCGGPTEAYAKVRPILESISPNLVYCGQIGNGHVAKIVNNAAASCNRLLTYEVAAVGVKYGLKLADMATVINKSSGASFATERILPALSQGGKTADFQLQLMTKDLRLAAQMANDCGAPMLIGNVVRSIFEAGTNELGATANLDDMARLFETLAGVRFGGA